MIDGEKTNEDTDKNKSEKSSPGIKITGIREKNKMTYSQKYCIKLYFEVLY